MKSSQKRAKRPIVFLHIPKTAGQTIHGELQRIQGPDKVSPVRVHTQVAAGETQLPHGYDLYSGHIDWIDLETLPRPFVFTVLRDPKERIASFYFYLLKEAQTLDEASLERTENAGKKVVLERSASDYFFGGDDSWQTFIHDHYDNVYCSYFATRKMRSWKAVFSLTQAEKIAHARHNLKQIDRVYSTSNLHILEKDLFELTAERANIAGQYVNAGDLPRNELRWPKLLARLESDKDVAKLSAFTHDDMAFLDAINLAV